PAAAFARARFNSVSIPVGFSHQFVVSATHNLCDSPHHAMYVVAAETKVRRVSIECCALL
ncbi:MAG: hypothetical protein ACK58H_06980, partial [Planctomyces sp.]